MSSRVEGNIVIGRKAKHGVAVAAAVAMGAVALGLGAWGGLAAYNATDGALAYADNGDRSESVASLGSAQDGAFVTVRLDGCLGRQTHRALAVDSRTVIVAASAIESDSTPTVVDVDGVEYAGKTIEIDETRDLAVIRVAESLSESLAWGSTQRVVGQTVTIFPLDYADRDDVAWLDGALVTDVVQRGNEVVGFSFDTPGEHGSAVIDSNGLLIGIVNPSGEAAGTAEQLSAFVSAAVLNPDNPSPICPAPPTTLPADDQEQTTDTDG